MPIDEEKYNQLLADYRDVQLRVTRFSAIEQELINTRNKVDQELELYKRLQEYSSKALLLTTIDELLQLITEALVDILELESAFIFFSSKDDNVPSRVFTEGWKYHDDLIIFEQELKHIQQAMNKQARSEVATDLLGSKRILSQFSSMLFASFNEDELQFETFFGAAISKSKENLYTPIQERHVNIFRIFVNQMQAILANRKSNLKIRDQIIKITRSENELRKLSLIATKTKSGVVISDTYGRIEWVNEAFTQITGYTLEEVIGRKPKDFLQSEQTDMFVKEQLSKALAEKKDIEVVLINKTKSGKPYYNQLEITSIFDDQGKHINFIALQRDISEKINHQEELISINSRFERIADFSKTGIWDYDLKTGQIIWNDLMYKITGVDSSRSYSDMRAVWLSLLLPEESKAVTEKVSQLVATGESHITQEHRIIRSNDKEERIVQSLTIVERDKNGEAVRLIGSIQDITDIRYLNFNLEKALAERDASLLQLDELKSFYERILRYSPSDIVVLDKSLQVIFSNIQGAGKNSIWNFPLHINLNEGEALNNKEFADVVLKIREAIQKRQLVQAEDNFIGEDGNTVSYLRSILPYFNAVGAFENAIIIGLDVSNLKKIENDVLEKNAELTKINSELDHFVYSISHDLRSPLLSIKGIISLVLQSSDLSPENVKFLNMTLTSATRLDNTIQEILEYSRNSRMEQARDQFNLIELIQSIFDDLKFSSNSPSHIFISIAGNPNVLTDKARLGVLLKNIIGNSIKYAKPDAGSNIEVTVRHEGPKVYVSIKDDGQGIPSRHLEKVFDMFYRANTESVGTGLGLYICKEIIKKLGGDIHLYSEQGKGTEVCFEFTELANDHEDTSDR